MKILRQCGRMLYGFLPHLLITCAVMALTFYCINRVNEAMNFLTARISTGFQALFWALTILTAGIAFVKNQARWFALAPMLGAAVLFVPIFRAHLLDHPLVAGKPWYQTVLLVTSVLTLVFAVALIVVQRAEAKYAYRKSVEAAAKAEKKEQPQEAVPAPAD